MYFEIIIIESKCVSVSTIVLPDLVFSIVFKLTKKNKFENDFINVTTFFRFLSYNGIRLKLLPYFI